MECFFYFFYKFYFGELFYFRGKDHEEVLADIWNAQQVCLRLSLPKISPYRAFINRQSDYDSNPIPAE